MNIADEIIPGLWVGDINSAKSIDFLRNNNIRLVINVTRDIPNYYENTDYPVEYKRVPVDDSLLYSDISSMTYYLPKVVKFIYENMGHVAPYENKKLVSSYENKKLVSSYENKNGNILIHCQAGLQRSAIVAAAYLVKYHHMTPNDAMAFVESKRPAAFFYGHFPNFEKSLISFYNKNEM
jgi:dual specificity phosphatase 12